LTFLKEGLGQHSVDLLAYCLMPNHWHLVVRPKTGPALGLLMGWVGVTHVRRHHEHYRTRGGGHLYQGRYKSFPVQEDRHFLLLCQYVESNALRAKLVTRAQDWEWGSAWSGDANEGRPTLAALPVDRPRTWAALLNEPVPGRDVGRLRTSVIRGSPFGDAAWIATMAKRLNLGHTRRGPGRPRKPTATTG
jgi:putative transposase